MARPATGQTPPISFRPPEQLLKEFDATVEEGRSRTDVLIELMHDRVAKKQRERKAAAPERPAGSEETTG
jgi:metal-responsive CopG/Arc/MetJ family transcriptional regulator